MRNKEFTFPGSWGLWVIFHPLDLPLHPLGSTQINPDSAIWKYSGGMYE